MKFSTRTAGIILAGGMLLIVGMVAGKLLSSSDDVAIIEKRADTSPAEINKAIISQNELLEKIITIEEQLKKISNQINTSQPKTDTAAFTRSQEDELLQRQIDDIAKQLHLLNEKKERTASANLQKEVQLYNEAANDMGMRQKYQQYQADLNNQNWATMEQSFDNELVEDSWAGPTQETIEANFHKNEALFASQLTSVDCRTSMCKVFVSLPESESGVEGASDRFILENEMIAALATDQASTSTIKSRPDGKGGTEYEIYLFRDGYQMPSAGDPMKDMTLAEKIEYIRNYR